MTGSEVPLGMCGTHACAAHAQQPFYAQSTCPVMLCAALAACTCQRPPGTAHSQRSRPARWLAPLTGQTLQQTGRPGWLPPPAGCAPRSRTSSPALAVPLSTTVVWRAAHLCVQQRARWLASPSRLPCTPCTNPLHPGPLSLYLSPPPLTTCCAAQLYVQRLGCQLQDVAAVRKVAGIAFALAMDALYDLPVLQFPPSLLASALLFTARKTQVGRSGQQAHCPASRSPSPVCWEADPACPLPALCCAHGGQLRVHSVRPARSL